MSTTDDNILLSKTKRLLLFSSLCLLRSFLVINLSALGAAVASIKSSLQLSDQQFSFFGTATGAGRILSAFAFIWIINALNRKYILIAILTIHCISLTLFANINNYLILLFLRFINGFCLVFCFVYFPMWVDQFSIQKYKNWMMTIISLFGSLGLLWGYLLALIFDKSQWRQIFLVEAIIMGTYAFSYLFVSENYFNKSLFFTKHEELRDEGHVSMRVVSIFNIVEKKKSLITECDSPETKKYKKNKKESICNSIFLFLCMSKSIQYFLGNASGFWYTDYCQTSLNITNIEHIVYSYTINWVIGPLIGQFLGGFICISFGGYDSKNAFLLASILQWLSIPFGIITPFMNSLTTYTIFMCAYNIFDLSSQVITNALILLCVVQELRGKASGIFSLCANVFGMLPGSYVYGFVKNHFKYLSNKAGMYFLMFLPILAGLLLFMGVIVQIYERRTDVQEQHFNSQLDKGTVLVDIKK